MKGLIILLPIVVFSYVLGQKLNVINVQGDFKLMNFNPQVYHIEKNSPYNVKINIQSYGVSYCIMRKKVAWSAGLSYMKIDYVIPDRITHWNYILYGQNDLFETYPYDTVYQVYQDPADYVASSANWGIHNELVYSLKNRDENEKFYHAYGIKSEVFFLEKFKHTYEVNDEVVESDGFVVGNMESPSSRSIYKNTFYISNINLIAFYQIRWFPHDTFSIGLRLNAGVNLYSDWSQFKKYSWLSLGAEMGFLVKKGKREAE